MGKRILLAVLLPIAFLSIEPLHGANKRFMGTLVDAHSQIRCDQKPPKIEKVIEEIAIDYILLTPGGCQKNEKFFSNMEKHQGDIAKFAKANEKIFYLAGMKKLSQTNKKHQSRWRLNTLKPALAIGEQAGDSFVGAGEVIIQHASGQKDYGINPGTQLGLLDDELQQVIKEFASRKFPVILHIELVDSADKAEQALRDLTILLDKYSDYPFVLNHVGQGSLEQVSSLISKHRNLYFLLGQTSGRFQIATRKQKAGAQNGWISFFDVNGKTRKEHIKNPVWLVGWRNLVEAHPERFVMGYDLVFASNWGKKLKQDVNIWRNALGQLDSTIAVQIACGNAKRLWRLPIDCKSQ
jgi:hypothetical protein